MNQLIYCNLHSGASDPISPPKDHQATAEAFSRLGADVTFHSFDECGHIPHFEVPDQVVDVIVPFLRRSLDER